MKTDHLRIALIVATYFAVSISLVFINKVLLTADGDTIPAPLFVTAFQCFLTSLICWIMSTIGRGAKSGFFAEFPEPGFNLNVARKVMPLSCVFVGMITFNNLCLLYVEVSFYNVARSLTFCFNVIFTYFILGHTTSIKVCATLIIIIVGFFVGSEGEVNFSLIGTLFGVLSSMFVSLNSIYTAKVLPAVQSNKWKLAFYNNCNAVFLFIPLIIVTGEIDIILAYQHMLLSTVFWSKMMLSGVLGFSIGIVVVMQIKATSPLTHNISGTAKACVQTLLAYFIWKNEPTFNAILGVVLVISGTLIYTYIRLAENSKPSQLRDIEMGKENSTKQTRV